MPPAVVLRVVVGVRVVGVVGGSALLLPGVSVRLLLLVSVRVAAVVAVRMAVKPAVGLGRGLVVAAHVAFDSKQILNPGFSLIGARVETRPFQAAVGKK
jgi:hypothetical protein